MKVIGFAASPRVGGNSDLLLDRWLAGAKEAGAEVEKVYLDQQEIRPCRACDACRRPGAAGCVVQDDMQPIYQKLIAADVWVLATPIYFWGPAAQLKLMVDRWYGMLRKRDLTHKRITLLITMGDDKPQTAYPTTKLFEMAAAYMKLQLLPPQVVTASGRGEILQNEVSLRQAYEAGKQAVME